MRDDRATEVTLRVGVPPSAVWRLVRDITVPPRFSPECRHARWFDGEGPAAEQDPLVGSRFSADNENAAMGAWTVVCTVVECRSEEGFSWVVGDPGDPVATWSFTLRAVEGGTRLTHHVRLGTGRSGLSAAMAAHPGEEARILAWRLGDLRRGMQATIEGLASVVTG